MKRVHRTSLIHAFIWSVISTIVFVGLALIFWTDSFVHNFDKYWPYFLTVVILIFVFVLVYTYIIENKKSNNNILENLPEENKNIFIDKTKNKKNGKK